MRIAPRKPALWPLLVAGAIVLAGALPPATRAETAATPTAADTPDDGPASAAPPDVPANAGEGDAETKAAWPEMTGQAEGGWVIPPRDPTADGPEDLTTSDLYDRISQSQSQALAGQALVTVIAVGFMQAAYGMIAVGVARSRKNGRTWLMHLTIPLLAGLAFWAYGFAFGWGNWFNGPVAPGWYAALGPGLSELNSGIGIGPVVGEDGNPIGVYRIGLLGTKGFFLHGVDPSVIMLFLFMLIFMINAAIIPIGAMAERWAMKSFLLYGLWIALPYSVYANWMWAGGWLAQAGLNWGLGHGAVDFAGSGVVFGLSGVVALAGCLVLGPRAGGVVESKPAPSGKRLAALIIGTAMLTVPQLQISLEFTPIGVNSLLSIVAGGLGAALLCLLRRKSISAVAICQGLLSGLVAITAACNFVGEAAAAIIGGIAGMLCVLSTWFCNRRGIEGVSTT